MKTSGFGIRGLFRIAIIIVFALAFIVLAFLSYQNVTADELAKAEASIRSEVNYLCLQLESLGEREEALEQVTDSTGLKLQDLDQEKHGEHQLVSDPVGNILKGYTLAETGTVVIIGDDTVIASDDERVPAGSDVRELLGDEVSSAIDASLQSGQMQAIPYRGVFDGTDEFVKYGNNDDEAFLLAGQQGAYTVAIVEPTSMVFRNREDVLRRESIVGFVVLIVLGAIVDRLLSLMIARRIDKTNEVLGRIVSGDLEARVEEKGTREFESLANGINVTVEALQGWIAEAEARMDSELSAARAIQESALPCTFPPYPDISKFDVYAIMDAAREVGGDFYDFFLIGDSGPDSGKLVFLIADVSGKGVPAALFMMKAKTEVCRELQSGSDLAQAIQNASQELADGNSACMFVTMWVGVLDYETGHLDYVNAGHNHPLIWHEGSGWRWLSDRSGLPLGLTASQSYTAFSIECSAGDKILLYTDGVTEARSADKKFYGDDRLEATVNAHANEHPEALVKALRHDVASFAHDAKQSDDITILALEVNA